MAEEGGRRQMLEVGGRSGEGRGKMGVSRENKKIINTHHIVLKTNEQ